MQASHASSVSRRQANYDSHLNKVCFLLHLNPANPAKRAPVVARIQSFSSIHMRRPEMLSTRGVSLNASIAHIYLTFSAFLV